VKNRKANYLAFLVYYTFSKVSPLNVNNNFKCSSSDSLTFFEISLLNVKWFIIGILEFIILDLKILLLHNILYQKLYIPLINGIIFAS
jgi:hypothetical protein